jgi:hypothetical protein
MPGSERARNARAARWGRGPVEVEFPLRSPGAITLPADPDLAVLGETAPPYSSFLSGTLAVRSVARYGRAAIRRRTHEHRYADQAG